MKRGDFDMEKACYYGNIPAEPLTKKQEMKDNASPYPEPAIAKCVADRAYEKDLEILRAFKGGKTFKAIEAAMNESDKFINTVSVVATVVGKTKTPPGSSMYRWKISLMDRDGKTMQFGSFEENDPVSEITVGVFEVTYGTHKRLMLNTATPLSEMFPEMFPEVTERSRDDRWAGSFQGSLHI